MKRPTRTAPIVATKPYLMATILITWWTGTYITRTTIIATIMASWKLSPTRLHRQLNGAGRRRKARLRAGSGVPDIWQRVLTSGQTSMHEYLNSVWEKLVVRGRGSLAFCLVLQPLAAA